MNIAGTAGRTCVRGANPRKADIQPVSVAPLDEASLALCPSFTSFSLPDPPLPLPQGCPIVIAQRGGRREKWGGYRKDPGFWSLQLWALFREAEQGGAVGAEGHTHGEEEVSAPVLAWAPASGGRGQPRKGEEGTHVCTHGHTA